MQHPPIDPQRRPPPNYPLDSIPDRKRPRNAKDLSLELQRAEAATVERVAPLPEEAWRWRPSQGGWCVAQILEHLARVNRSYSDFMEKALDKNLQRSSTGSGGPDSPSDAAPSNIDPSTSDQGAATADEAEERRFVPRLFEGWFIAFLEPPPRWKMPAPRRATLRGETYPPRDRILDDYRQSLAVLYRLLEEIPESCLGRVRFPDPYFPPFRLTLGGGFATLAAHERRHHLQLRNLLERPEFGLEAALEE
ncbi:MAG: DinB family protein [Acidobacteriota bacterium]